MATSSAPRVSVINFNSPELNQLALALARDDRLASLVRPYLNKQRAWERVLASLPLAGTAYQRTFGRRQALDATHGGAEGNAAEKDIHNGRSGG